MPDLLFANNASSLLAVSIGTGDTSIQVQAGEGTLFPDPTGNEFFQLTLEDDSGNIEIVQCTSRGTDILTVVRAQELTSALAFTATVTRCELRLTKLQMDTFIQDVGNESITGTFQIDDTLIIDEPGASAENRAWRIDASAELLAFQLSNDAQDTFQSFMEVTRTANVVDLISFTGAIAVSSTVDGRDLAVDGTKLDGIEDNAKDDQTITLTTDVTGSGSGSFATTLQPAGISNKSLVTAVSGDNLLLLDATDGQLKKCNVNDFLGIGEVNDLTAAVTWANVPNANITVGSVTQHVASIVHDSTSGGGGNKHIDHGAVSINSGDGLSGGGTITSTRTITVDSTVIRTTGSQTVGGLKTFTTLPKSTGEGVFVHHVTSGYTGGSITVSTSNPSGGVNGDIWFKV